MKYCQYCGSQLDDSAKFCPNCGAAQPEFKPKPAVKEEDKPEPISEENMVPYTESEDFKRMSDGEKFNYFMENDEKFRDIYQVSRKKRFFNFINLAFLIPFFVCLFSPIGVFTGVNVHPDGAAIFNGMGWSFPHTFSPMTLQTIDKLTGNKALAPNSINGVIPILLFVFGLVLIPLIAVFTAIGTPKSYYLKTYLRPNGGAAELLKFGKQNNGFMMGAIGVIFGFVGMLNVYISISGINYEKAYQNNGNKLYLFGEISELSSGLVTGIIVSIIFLVLIIVGIAVPTSLVTKKLKKYQ